jgi:hypothetical protein
MILEEFSMNLMEELSTFAIAELCDVHIGCVCIYQVKTLLDVLPEHHQSGDGAVQALTNDSMFAIAVQLRLLSFLPKIKYRVSHKSPRLT